MLAEIDPLQMISTSDNSQVFYRTESGLAKIDLKTGQNTAIPIQGEMRLDRSGEYLQMFNEAWTAIKYHFYDPDFHGIDWDAAYQRYLPLIERTRTAWEFRNVISRMIGELNASHLDIYGGDDPGLPEVQTGRTGLHLGSYVEAARLPDPGSNRRIACRPAGVPDRTRGVPYAINRHVLTPAEPMAKYLNGTVNTLIEFEIQELPPDNPSLAPYHSNRSARGSMNRNHTIIGLPATGKWLKICPKVKSVICTSIRWGNDLSNNSGMICSAFTGIRTH